MQGVIVHVLLALFVQSQSESRPANYRDFTENSIDEQDEFLVSRAHQALANKPISLDSTTFGKMSGSAATCARHLKGLGGMALARCVLPQQPYARGTWSRRTCYTHASDPSVNSAQSKRGLRVPREASLADSHRLELRMLDGRRAAIYAAGTTLWAASSPARAAEYDADAGVTMAPEGEMGPVFDPRAGISAAAGVGIWMASTLINNDIGQRRKAERLKKQEDFEEAERLRLAKVEQLFGGNPQRQSTDFEEEQAEKKKSQP
eukprot:gnl/TRDRNA2_/TRDRNA2_196809_c0_seq1.p1 gnl/TRDRNA2_/TRDRNA2_196809_c0~~gnl/TRDRNA2_/TRDRNA2_196809_c0_seq1.p1  ORF type:complete len:262 (+),score=37.78 gnl/TRDRNA2_/TRDRNA2_196809_c0_seq1:113-898(+)